MACEPHGQTVDVEVRGRDDKAEESWEAPNSLRVQVVGAALDLPRKTSESESDTTAASVHLLGPISIYIDTHVIAEDQDVLKRGPPLSGSS